MVKIYQFIKSIYKLAITLVCILIFFALAGCAVTEQSDNNQSNSKIQNNNITLKKDILEIPIDVFPHGKVSSDEYIVSKSAENRIYIYNVKNKSLREVAKPNDSHKFIKYITGNSNWIIWFENEAEIVNVENKPYNWDLVAKNLKTGEKTVIDKSSFKSNKFNVPTFVNYTPSKITISNQDILVYSKAKPDGDKNVLSELVVYDLKAKKSKVIAKTDSVINELIDNFSIFESKVVWSKYRKLNPSYEKRLTQYEYSDLFIFDNVSGKYEQLAKNEFFDNPILYENYLAAVKVPEREKNTDVYASDVILMDLKDKKIKNLINKENTSFANNSSELYYITISINDKYLTWKPIGGGDNRFIYEYKKDKFVEVIEKNNDNPLFYEQIYEVYGNDIFVHDIQGENDKNKNYLIKLQ